MLGCRVRWIVGFVLLLLLGGCYLSSGERSDQTPLVPGGVGEYAVQLVSADGSERRVFATDWPIREMVVEVVVESEKGELILEILNPDFTTALTVSGRYGMSAEGRIIVATDGAGHINYRITANEVYHGSFRVQYYVYEKPAPTPSPTTAP
jgi:hypothetical protein